MFIPGCGWGGTKDPCKPCPNCAPPCVTLEFQGFSHDTENCNECTYLDDMTFVLKRPTGCPTVSLSVADATGGGASLTYTVEKQEDGSCAVTKLELANECLDISSGGSKSSDEKSGLGGGTGSTTSSKNTWPCGDGEWTTTNNNVFSCKNVGDPLGGSKYSEPTLSSSTLNGTQCIPATAKFTIDTTEPAGKFSLTSSTGSGATVLIGSYDELTWTDSNKAWAISSLEAVSGGTSYAEGQIVTLAPVRTTVSTLQAATATVDAVLRYAPPISVSAKSDLGISYDGNASVESFTDSNGRQSFRIAGVAPTAWYPVCGFSKTSVALPTTASISVTGFSGTLPIVYLRQPDISVVLDETGCANGFSVNDPGSFYVTTGRPTALSLTSGGAYRTEAAITAVELIDGGEYWPANSCVYTSCKICPVCPYPDYDLDPREELYASFSAGSTFNTVTVWRRSYYTYGTTPRGRYNDYVILSATQSSLGEDGSPIDCDKFKFKADSITKGCTTNGTVTVSSAACSEKSKGYCETKADIPDQITLSLAGMGQLMLWRSQNGGGLGGPCPDPGNPGEFLPYEPFCGQCDTDYDIMLRGGGTLYGPACADGALVQQDFEVVLDRDERDDCYWSWSGFAPTPPSEGGCGQTTRVDCGGALEVPVSVSIGPVGLETTVFIDAPTKQAGEVATAEVTEVGEGGAIDEVALITPGSGYAVEIFERQSPTITATVPSTSGTGAVLAVTLTQEADYSGNKYWDVTKVTVTNGGEGYIGTESVSFEAAEGDTADYPASARIVVERQAPTLSVAAPGSGSGAVLSVSLSQGTDYNGEKIWSVSSVGVTSGGSGYADGEAVTFTVDEGLTVYGASATVNVGREEPTVQATVYSWNGGSGASVSPSVQPGYSNDWTVSAVTVTNGGTGYAQWDYIQFTTTDTEGAQASAYVSSVDENGTILSIAVYGGGSYWHPTGVIESVSVGDGGQYFNAAGPIQSVIIEWGGSYYRLVGTGVVDADEPHVLFRSYVGKGATATATVDTNLASETFGQITGIEITNGGENYRLSGTGSAVSISLGVIRHLEWLLGVEIPPEPNEDDALDCANFWDKNLPIENRISLEPCPEELLDRTYTMYVGNFGLPHGDPSGEGLSNAIWCHTPPTFYGSAYSATFFEFGNGPITCTISPA